MSTISPDVYFDSVHRIVTLLDRENITILRTMKEHGPRNLLEIARKAKLPYTTVYNRVTKLESQGVLKTTIHPNYPKIGLSPVIVWATTYPGKEVQTREALKVPGYWIRLAKCLGECNGYYSLQTVPSTHRHDFELFLKQLVERRIVKNYKIYWLGETTFPLTNFEYFSAKDKTWKFKWKDWLDALTAGRAKPDPARQPVHHQVSFDERDLIILRELYKDARKTLADMAKILGLTLPATKYRFDKLIEKDLVKEYVIELLPFAPQVSKLADVRLDFKNENALRGVESQLSNIPFIQYHSQITGLNSMMVRLYLPNIEVSNLLAFLSLLVSKGVLTNYSYLIIDPMTIQAQSFPYKSFGDRTGWSYVSREYLKTVESLIAKWTKAELEPNYQTLPPISI